jgi:hypothetical protein
MCNIAHNIFAAAFIVVLHFGCGNCLRMMQKHVAQPGIFYSPGGNIFVKIRSMPLANFKEHETQKQKE